MTAEMLRSAQLTLSTRSGTINTILFGHQFSMSEKQVED